jgi:hypothetical protein
MAYLVIMVVDNAPYEAGDVISWRPEGSQIFGLKMVQHPFFRVLHVPDMTDAQAESLTARQLGDVRVNPLLKARAFKLDPIPLRELVDAKRRFVEKWDGVKYLVPEDATATNAQVTPLVRTKAIESVEIGEPVVIG